MLRRWLVRVGVVVLVVGVGLFVLDRTFLLVPISGKATSMAPTIPACNGRAFAEGLTYRFRDPHRGEIVVFHAVGRQGGAVAPDASARDLALAMRVVGVPGDEVVGRDGRVYVNGFKSDDITTANFPRVDLAGDEYFVLGDNRSFSQDSRDFGPVRRDAIFGRVFLVMWPLGDFGAPESRHAGAPPGSGLCD